MGRSHSDDDATITQADLCGFKQLASEKRGAVVEIWRNGIFMDHSNASGRLIECIYIYICICSYGICIYICLYIYIYSDVILEILIMMVIFSVS